MQKLSAAQVQADDPTAIWHKELSPSSPLPRAASFIGALGSAATSLSLVAEAPTASDASAASNFLRAPNRLTDRPIKILLRGHPARGEMARLKEQDPAAINFQPIGTNGPHLANLGPSSQSLQPIAEIMRRVSAKHDDSDFKGRAREHRRFATSQSAIVKEHRGKAGATRLKRRHLGHWAMNGPHRTTRQFSL